MRPRPLAALAFALSSIVASSEARSQTSSSDGLVRGDYIRVSGASVSPVNPGGSLRQWKRGTGVNVMWETWDNGSNGNLGLIGFGLYGDLSLLPFDSQQFIKDFTNGPNGAVTSARAGNARVIQLGVNTRFRIPVSFITPSISVGFGFLDWHPAQISYTAVSGNGTAKQQNRQGGVVTFIGGLDKNIYDRFAIFAEAAYAYGFTSFGQSLQSSGSSCVASNCDLLKNTPLGTIRAGLRVRTR